MESLEVKEMAWLSHDRLKENGTKVLHIRLNRGHRFMPYTQFFNLRAPDHKIAGGSKGYATMQKLLKMGFRLVPSNEVQS